MAAQLLTSRAQAQAYRQTTVHSPNLLSQRSQRTTTLSAQPLTVSRLREVRTSAQRDDDVQNRVSGVLKTGDNLAEGATDALTGGAPRPLVKGALVLVGGLFAWSLLKKALSLALFFGVIGGGLYLVFKLKFQGAEAKGSDSTDPDSPLQQARDIWNKYK